MGRDCDRTYAEMRRVGLEFEQNLGRWVLAMVLPAPLRPLSVWLRPGLPTKEAK
jgi:hypothetical protein